MKNQIKKSHPIIKSVFNMLMDLPAPSSISYMWNWGSLLSLSLMIQILTGILLASHYISDMDLAFSSVIHILRDVNMGWFIRNMHMNTASLFFVMTYIHISRGMLFSSFKSLYTWASGVMMLFILIITAFLGYVLPWGQMSFWGATVITNLVSAVPFIGNSLVEWIWGGFSISGATLSRFFAMHFLMPFILSAMLMIHLVSLHMTGSKSPSGMYSNMDKITFHPYFSSKDTMGMFMFMLAIMIFTNQYPFVMGDPENFNMANPLSTPIHIQPEWYFLFAYAILRSIPNKLGGVLAMMTAILVIMIFPFKKNKINSSKFNPKKKSLLWMMVSTFIILTWIGANPVEYPFEEIGQLNSILYFYFIVSMYLSM